MSPKFGIFSWFGYVMPLWQRAQLIRQAGFDTVSLWWEDEQGYGGGQKHHLPDMVYRTGLQIDHLHAPCLGCRDLWSQYPFRRNAFVCQQRQNLQDCRRHGVRTLVTHVEEQNQVVIPGRAGIDSMMRIVDEAERCDVTVAIENVWHEDVIDYLLEMIQSERLGLCYDSAHHDLYGNPTRPFANQYRKRLVSTHFSDHDGRQDCHWLPGLGITDWRKLGACFPDDYVGCYLLEVYPCTAQQTLTPEEFLQQAYHALQQVTVHCS